MSAFFQRNPIFLLVARGWQFAGKYRFFLLTYLLMFTCAVAITLAEPYVIGRALNAVQTDAASATKNVSVLWKNVSTSLYIYFFIQLGFWLLHGPARCIERYAAFHIKASFKKQLFTTVTQLPIQWHRQHHSGESIDKINRAALALGMFFENSFQVIYMTLRLLGSLVILFCFMPFAGWVGVGTTIFAFVNIYLFDRQLYKQYFELNKFENSIASAVHDYISNIGSVITLRLENRVVGEVVRRMLAPVHLFRANIITVEVKWFLTTMMIATMITMVLLNYAHKTIFAGHAVLGGTFFSLFEYLRRIGDSFYNFAALYGNIVRQAADVESADTICSALLAAESQRVDALPQHWNNIHVTGLCFRYEDEKHRVHHLDDISLLVKRGLAIALVGESGSGKSTLLSLLRGLQEPEQVTVTCDGKVLPDKLAHLASHTTLIPQDPEIFADTILFNITFGLDAEQSDVMQAIRLARFEQVLARLPLGLNTNITEKGVNLSGGEKQRLALARGIFFAKESDILLLDEPTSSVDTLNEQIIYTNLLSEYKGKCIISSIHKLHLLPMFDVVYVFSRGKLIEQGSFEQLVAHNGQLAAMWQKYQATAGTDDDTTVAANR